jgi:hypothetical protein
MIVVTLPSRRYFWVRQSNITVRDVVDSEQATIVPVVGTALRASAEVAEILVCLPHVVTAHCAIASLEEHAAASDSVTPAASRLFTAAM